jgi:SPP1 family holin
MKNMMLYVRATVFVLAMLNQLLWSLGVHWYHFDNSQVTNVVTNIFTMGVAVWGFLEHNPIGKKAKAYAKRLEELILHENDKKNK